MERAPCFTVTGCYEAEIWQRGTRTQGENVSATRPGHMVLLDGLVESCLAQQQEAEANPHGQQPGHGKAESAGWHAAGEKQQGDRGRVVLQHVSIYIYNTHCVYFMCQKDKQCWHQPHTSRPPRRILSPVLFFFFQSNTANGKKKMTKGLWGKSQRSNTNFNMLISHHKKESKETRGKKTPCLQFFLDCKNDSPLFRKTRVIKNNSKTVFLSTGSLLADLCSDCLMAGEGQHMETRLSPYWIMRLSSFPGVIRASLHSIPPHPQPRNVS